MRYFDLHCDTARVCYKNGIMPDDNSLSSSFKKGEALNVWHQCFAVFVPDGCPEPKREYENTLSDFKSKISAYKKPKCFYALENALPIDSIEYVSRLAGDKIKAVTLTWNNENALAGGVNCDASLKPFGREVIKALNSHKIALDLSHLNRQSFFAAGEAADTVFASHVCCYKTHKHPRNLTDEQIKYIAERGGVLGICFYPEFLGTKYAFEGVWRHINHLLNMGLQEHVCIGSDFDGADMSETLDGVDKIPSLYKFLKARGLSEELDGIFFGTAEKFFKKL